MKNTNIMEKALKAKEFACAKMEVIERINNLIEYTASSMEEYKTALEAYEDDAEKKNTWEYSNYVQCTMRIEALESIAEMILK